jgi:catechol 2,3-dioxygenase-like lactoylglutathione lyase family enzyme
MDALHPRLLVEDFPRAYAFYQAVLPELVGADLAAGGPAGPYASWDVDGQGLLSLFDRQGMAEIIGDAAQHEGRVVFVCRVDDVDKGAQLCLAHGATLIAEPTDRPAWGVRTAHVRDPEGVVMELQAY